MVVFVMGAPRAKSGAPISRPIISTLRDVSYPQWVSVPSDSQRSLEASRPTLNASHSYNCLSLSSRATPMCRQSHTDTIDGVFEAERLCEIRRQKELMLQACLLEIEELVSINSQIGRAEASPLETESMMSLSRQASPWKLSHTPSSLHTGRALLYIHESPQSVPLVPCRGDLVYATLKHRSVAIGSPSECFLLLTPTLRLPPMDAKLFAMIVLEEMLARHELLLREDRLWRRINGKEAGAFLRVQLVIRTGARFHHSRLSTLKDIRRKELEYLRDGICRRADKQEEEHRIFMHQLPPERLPPLKIPTLTSAGQPYGRTAVDHAVARALAVEEQTWTATARRKKCFFPPIV
ncbi:uncharacterized protein Tco025E_04655 [Trypanosoma conorhini]|uniref:Uncharacterized protein n=1 Tax=Trypanosoma conorhini TaxID=83891 RepID=A0A3S5ITH7_9TRYP|nr:uncharacterized protein Tco025E_04655 [Trypanosoma conorhini]RNF17910.1 hypothetical protein Tco025E_04655 [Trypanosoma conorhini]